jgi:acyl-coenzyme A thioesterase PaaI-like protein
MLRAASGRPYFLSDFKLRHCPVFTRNLDTRFLKPAVGPITAKARVVERTDRDMVVRPDLVDAEGIIVADATARLHILAREIELRP